jgi:Rad3-related DNA helicase
MPRGNNRKIMLDTFYTSTKPYVLISPSLTEGLDLKEDLSRLCIICKVPYANLTDKWIKERMKENQEWYINQACTTMVQMTGRSIRSETDFATTYILDKDFLTLANSGINMFPKWWKDSVVSFD